MPPEMLDAIGPLIALGGLGVFSLIGLRMLLAYRTRRMELSAGGDAGRIEEVVESLRAEVQLLRGEVGELHERVDFTERLLARTAGASSPPDMSR